MLFGSFVCSLLVRLFFCSLFGPFIRLIALLSFVHSSGYLHTCSFLLFLQLIHSCASWFVLSLNKLFQLDLYQHFVYRVTTSNVLGVHRRSWNEWSTKTHTTLLLMVSFFIFVFVSVLFLMTFSVMWIQVSLRFFDTYNMIP